MDEPDVFWADVLKRWSDASQNVVRLRKELTQTQEERDKYRHELHSFKQVTEPFPLPFGQPTTATLEAYPPSSTVTSNKLQEAEAGLGRAKHEYQKLRDQLKDSEQRIESLVLQITALQRERDTIQAYSKNIQEELETLQRAHSTLQSERDELNRLNNDIQEQLKTAQAELSASQLGNDDLTQKLQLLSNISHENETLRQQLLQLNEVSTNKQPQDWNKARVYSLEEQVERLEFSNQALEKDNKSLRDELKTAHGNLHKIKESNNVLHETITKLKQLARHVVVPASHKPHVASARTTQSVPAEVIPSVNIASLPNALKKPVKPTANHLTVDSGKEDPTIVEPSVSKPQSSSVTPRIPPHRQMEIDSFPVFIPDVDAASDHTFDREFMKNALGGSIQPLIVRITASQTPLAETRNISSYLCPGLDHNPWCPSTPGENGYIFVGLGKEKDTFELPEIHSVFVGLKKTKTKDNRRFRYLGKYIAKRVEPLSPQEWKTLAIHVRCTYVQTTKAKTKDVRTLDAIMAAYDSGELLVPCVRLQCIGFDEQLFGALISKMATPSSKSTSAARTKRTREGNEGDESCERKKRTVRQVQ
ncbi:uncharacterized protein LACBIDRAFT_300769 [Laccaria bicolor S238N-H82]|uniref:DUF6697 domain-containing protein n=1 Tax=Laccaria bicolor (strain S238N-H82 / ATCC MYA-4686) TaxID=486041 RepID=B0CQH4_LACBS|nr:uncharacterized protein LACBIDRAFT_300769 [Laccaria bicolor S238N-H82]EDR15034.1 hypothetical protein LACBIDRAFT_300769 [Laccaria bicolor S238N-H82]|eukprot:XP_001873242.1 hypothetical protein LACBIDRAFT_300769 [Laccaria bicolor S238N-H82]